MSACSDAEELDLDSEEDDSELELSDEDSVEDDMSNVDWAAPQRRLSPMASNKRGNQYFSRYRRCRPKKGNCALPMRLREEPVSRSPCFPAHCPSSLAR